VQATTQYNAINTIQHNITQHNTTHVVLCSFATIYSVHTLTDRGSL